MPKPSKRKLQLKNARESLAKKRELNYQQSTIQKITDHLKEIDEQELQKTYDAIFKLSDINKSHSSKIINIQNEMSETDLNSTLHLIQTMRYPHGKRKDQIISPYIQN